MSTVPTNIPTNSQAPLNPDLAGYPDIPRLVDGYRNSSAEAQRQRERAEKAEGLAQEALRLATTSNTRQHVPDRSYSPADRLTEMGVPVEALDAYIAGKIGEAFEPIVRGTTARGKVVANHPDYVQYENDVAAFVQNDPDLSQSYPKLFQADPVGAMEFAFLKFGESRRRTVGSTVSGNRDGMRDAQIPGSQAGEGRRVPDDPNGVQAAFERWKQTGTSQDAAAYAKARLHGIISEDFLRQ